LHACEPRIIVTAQLSCARRLHRPTATAICTPHNCSSCANMSPEKGDAAEYRPLSGSTEDDGDAGYPEIMASYKRRDSRSRTTTLYLSLSLNVILAIAAAVVLVRFPREQTCINFFNEACTSFLGQSDAALTRFSPGTRSNQGPGNRVRLGPLRRTQQILRSTKRCHRRPVEEDHTS
jgi:hypothetical protein